MTKKMKIPEKLQVWIDAHKKYHLSHVHIQMARELGMNPRKFGKPTHRQTVVTFQQSNIELG